MGCIEAKVDRNKIRRIRDNYAGETSAGSVTSLYSIV